MNKVSKTVKVDKIDYETLYGVVKPHLHSDLIDFYVDVEDEWGTVIVGMIRPVGKIRFSKIES